LKTKVRKVVGQKQPYDPLLIDVDLNHQNAGVTSEKYLTNGDGAAHLNAGQFPPPYIGEDRRGD
jgi:hypothetical protein